MISQPENLPNMKSDKNGLSQYFKIIQQFIKCYAGEGVAVSARQAVDAITPAAEYGDAKAQMLLGKYYSWGYHSECNNRKAIHWFEKAAANGNAEAAMLIMEIYRNDCPDGIEAERRKALILEWHRRWFDILATKAGNGSIDAARSLMNLYIEDCPEDIAPDDGLDTARKWYNHWVALLTAKADKGDSVDKMQLADIFLYAEGVPEELLDCFTEEDDERSLSQAIRLYRDISDSDCDDFFKAEAYYKMGIAYHDLGDEEKAFTCFKKAAKLNWHEAYAKIGDAYRYGNGIGPDDEAARKWYRKGADVGEITATLQLAGCYKNGIGGKQDYAKAMDCYLMLAERINGRGFKHQSAGIGTALYELGNMYLNGLGTSRDFKKAIRYFTLAAKKCNNTQAEDKLNELLQDYDRKRHSMEQIY